MSDFPGYIPDKDEIRSRLAMSWVCAKLGIVLNRDNRAVCPFHDDRDPSFYLWEGDNGDTMFWCQPCGLGGDVFSLLMRSHGVTFPESVRRAAAMLEELPTDYEPPRLQTSIRVPFETWHGDVLAAQQLAARPDHAGILAKRSRLVPADGDDALAARWDTYLRGTWGWGISDTGEVYMPHWSPDGTMTGCKLRAVGTRKQSLPGSKYAHLYGAWLPRVHRDLILTEGEADAVFAGWCAAEDGVPVDVRALPSGAGQAVSAEWIKELGGSRVVYLAFDPDDKGVEATREWIRALDEVGGFSDVRVCCLPLGRDLRDARPRLRSLLEEARKPLRVPDDEVAAAPGGYVRQDRNGNLRAVTTWTIDPVAQLSGGEDPGYDSVLRSRGTEQQTIIRLADLASAQTLNKWANRHGELFTGTDADRQVIARWVKARGAVTPEVFQTDRVGVHFPPARYDYAGPTVVLPSSYLGKLPWRYAPTVRAADVSDRVLLPTNETLRWRWLEAFLKLNSPESMQPILAWLVAASRRAELREFPLLFVGGSSGVGKAQPLDEPVLTPLGWVAMGDIRPGDYVVGSDGRPTEVLATHPRGEMDVYEVYLSDGSSTRCSEDHLWLVGGRDYVWPRVLSTKDLAAQISSEKRLYRYIPVASEAEFTGASLPVHPYLLGLLLGDGHFAGGVSLCTGDPAVIAAARDLLPDGVRVTKWGKSRSAPTYRFVTKRGTCNPLLNAVRDLGLDGTRSRTKFVPPPYLLASGEERMLLLHGLMDSDGYVSRDSHTSFTSTSSALAEGVMYLVRSLGGVASLRKHSNKYGLVYTVHVKMQRCPFSLSRKVNRWRPSQQVSRIVRSVVPAGRAEMQCITVDAPDGLYVTKDFIVTHNSTIARLAIQLMGSGVEVDLGANTPFILYRTLAASSSLPVFVDEWTRLSRQDTREAFQGIVPLLYTGGTAERGMADLNTMGYKVTAPTIVAGEDTFTLDRELERTVCVYPTRAAQNVRALAYVQGQPLEAFGQLLHRFVTEYPYLPEFPKTAPDRATYNMEVLRTGWRTLHALLDDAAAHGEKVPDLPEEPDLSCFHQEPDEMDENVYVTALTEASAMHDPGGVPVCWVDSDGNGTWVRFPALIGLIESRRLDVQLPGRSRAMRAYFAERYGKVVEGRVHPPLGTRAVRAHLVPGLSLEDKS